MGRSRGWGVGGTVVVFALMAWVAAAGSVSPLRASAGAPPRTPPAMPTPASGMADRVSGPPYWLESLAAGWPGMVAKTLLAVLALGCLVAILRRRPQWVLRRTHRPAERAASAPSRRGPSAAVVDDAAGQEAVLAEGAPRNAIVACWLRLEEAAGEAGVARRPAETSSELTERILGEHAVDPASISVLGGLYREARFSRHDMGEPQREQALVALRALHADLARRRPAPDDAPRTGGPASAAGRRPRRIGAPS